MNRFGLIQSLAAVAVSASLLAGCGDLTEYTAPNLNMTVVRLDPALEGRWGTTGVVIESVSGGASIQKGDLVTHLVTRTEVNSADALQAALKKAMAPRKAIWQVRTAEPSDAAALLEIERNGETLHVELATREAKDWNEHGATFNGTTVSGLRDGYEDVPSASPAENAGLMIGDRIVAVIDENEVLDVKSFKKSAEMASSATNVYVYTNELSGIRLEAIRAVGELGGSDATVLARLKEIMTTSRDAATRRTVAKAFETLAAHQTDTDLLQFALGSLNEANEPDVEIRRSAAAIVETLVDTLPTESLDDETMRSIAAAMQDSDPGVHFKAGVIVGKFGDRAISLLVESLQPTNTLRVRDIAATALGDIGGTQARQALIDALRQTADVPLQLTMATALSRIGDAPSLQELRAFLSRTSDSGVQEFVRQLLQTGSAA
ncbi:MAG: HEAT repeat domain-containing protein [Candidatus Poribacteria bacterium]|nr:HEAT repeat domain-containing protein [Candidatus Poribacteria bacterium]